MNLNYLLINLEDICPNANDKERINNKIIYKFSEENDMYPGQQPEWAQGAQRLNKH